METRWKYWGDKGGKERNWPPYLTMLRPRTSVLSNRHYIMHRLYMGLTFTFYVKFLMKCILGLFLVAISTCFSFLEELQGFLSRSKYQERMKDPETMIS